MAVMLFGCNNNNSSTRLQTIGALRKLCDLTSRRPNIDFLLSVVRTYVWTECL